MRKEQKSRKTHLVLSDTKRVQEWPTKSLWPWESFCGGRESPSLPGPFPGPRPLEQALCFLQWLPNHSPTRGESQTLKEKPGWPVVWQGRPADKGGQGGWQVRGPSRRPTKKTLRVKLLGSSWWSPELATWFGLNPWNRLFSLCPQHSYQGGSWKKKKIQLNKTKKNNRRADHLSDCRDSERKSPPFHADVTDILPAPGQGFPLSSARLGAFWQR